MLVRKIHRNADSKVSSNCARCNSAGSDPPARQIARLEALSIDVERLIPIRQIVFGILQHGFCLQHPDKRASKVEQQIPFLIGIGRLLT